MRRIVPYIAFLLVSVPGKLISQHVLYSGFYNGRRSHTQVIGKSQQFYWLQQNPYTNSERRKVFNSNTGQDFLLLDADLNEQAAFSGVYLPGTIKQWLVAGGKGLDQVIMVAQNYCTSIFCNRFCTDGTAKQMPRIIDSLPFSAKPSRLILTRSEDQSKILLLAFENTANDVSRLDAILFDADWNIIYHKLITGNMFSQPFIQDDDIGFPTENFDTQPLKLANSGEWLMAAPSQTNNNLSVLQVCAGGNDFYVKEVPVSPFYKMEDIAMSIDNQHEEISLGLLSGYLNTSFKNVIVYNYALANGSFSFDSSYRFNTLSADIHSKNISHNRFLPVPVGGFLFLKEYGADFNFASQQSPVFTASETAFLLSDFSGSRDARPSGRGYSLHPGLHPIPVIRHKGDLNIFYFPSRSKDSVWTGIMEMEQKAESNNPDLSYLFLPSGDKLYILYNEVDLYQEPVASTTTITKAGRQTGDGLIFWKMNKSLNFQRARRFSSSEVAVPYLDNQRAGFAIIRL